MSLTALFAARPALWPRYQGPLERAFAEEGLDVRLTREASPGEVDVIILTPDTRIRDFRPYGRAKAVLSLWAGVERLLANPTLTQPLARMVDPGLIEDMTAYVTAQVLRHHLGLDRYIVNPGHDWRPGMPPRPGARAVTVLGLGALGAAAARALAGLGFDVAGWSRGAKRIAGITCLSGEEALITALARAEILVTLLPHTAATENLLDAARLAQLPRGAVIVNPGRGTLIDDAALLAALDSGQVAHATLDVFREEPLPSDHPFWAHPRVTVTPHIAAETRPETAARVIAENVRRLAEGAPLLHIVDRARGY